MLNLRQFAYDYNLKQREIADIIGVDQSVVSLIMKGVRKITRIHLDRLIERFGEQTIAAYDVEEDELNVPTRTAQVSIIPTHVVDAVREEARKEDADPKPEDAEIIETLEAIPIVSLEQAKAPDFDVKRHVFGKSNEIERKNFNEWFVTIIKQVGLFDVVSPVVSDRMMPTYMPNDRIFSKYLLHATNDTYIEQGIYLLDTDSGNILCNVRDLDNGSLELSFDNSRKYRPRIIKKKDVKSIAQVVMILRFGTMAFDVMDFAQLQQQMVVKDEQYRLLMEQYNKTGDRVNRVIDQNQQLINTLIDVVKNSK